MLLVTKGIAARSKVATSSSWPYFMYIQYDYDSLNGWPALFVEEHRHPRVHAIHFQSVGGCSCHSGAFALVVGRLN